MMTTAAAPLTVDDIVRLRRKKHRLHFGLYLVLIALVLWSIQATIIDDTDWDRIGSLAEIGKSVSHFIGIDYTRNKELSIYPRILNDYVRLGIEMKVNEVNFGRTSSEIKSTLGAIPEDLTCYLRHRRTLATLLFKPLVRKIKMKMYFNLLCNKICIE